MLTVEFVTTGECDRLYVERMLRSITEHVRCEFGFRFNLRLPIEWFDEVTDNDTTAQLKAARKKG